MRQIFFRLKAVLEKIVINLHSPVLDTMRLRDIGQKNFTFIIPQTGWQIMICFWQGIVLSCKWISIEIHSTSLTSTSMKIFIDILLSVKRGLEKFRPHFPRKLEMSTKNSIDILLPHWKFCAIFPPFFLTWSGHVGGNFRPHCCRDEI